MVSTSRPWSCSFLMTLLVSAPDVGWLYVYFCRERSHELASLVANRCCPELRATGTCVSPESLMSGPSGIVGRAPRFDLD